MIPRNIYLVVLIQVFSVSLAIKKTIAYNFTKEPVIKGENHHAPYTWGRGVVVRSMAPLEGCSALNTRVYQTGPESSTYMPLVESS